MKTGSRRALCSTYRQNAARPRILSEEPPALSFAVMPQKHAGIDCNSGYRLPLIFNSLR